MAQNRFITFGIEEGTFYSFLGITGTSSPPRAKISKLEYKHLFVVVFYSIYLIKVTIKLYINGLKFLLTD